ncbi:uncharacterized protein [Macaca fascicularis]|uniref:uncharacterized protein LOC106997240 n=1 Tax=Macaca mulatta TaxID=9544 RepID=UPI000732BC95|nr:uncharacterized protein LOC106997240 [Macaca mulatta]XP_024645801.1 uncharacterized protein LOC112425035 [Macaca nemestrina]
MRRPPRLCEAATRRRAVQQRAGTGGGSAAAGGGESPPPPAGPGSSTRDRKGPEPRFCRVARSGSLGRVTSRTGRLGPARFAPHDRLPGRESFESEDWLAAPPARGNAARTREPRAGASDTGVAGASAALKAAETQPQPPEAGSLVENYIKCSASPRGCESGEQRAAAADGSAGSVQAWTGKRDCGEKAVQRAADPP